ncbi:MAG: polysaccharide biosynthesis tyrosine autokinase [Leptothrix sp. (in: b-proteobacteria)]
MLRNPHLLAEHTPHPASVGLPSIGPARPIGEILGDRLHWSPEQVENILLLADAKKLRFGDAAVSLGHATAEEVVIALAEQFQYPYAPQDRHMASTELVMLNQPFSAQAEAIRAIRSQMMRHVFRHNDRRRALAIVSPDSGDGKTFLAANLAVALAQMGGRTLLVDADLRGPRLHEVVHVDNHIGLSSALMGRTEAQIIQGAPNIPGLFVLPGGTSPPNPLELIERAAFGHLMEQLPHLFDHVIVDTPAAAYGSDAQAVADRCGATLLVARRNESRVGALRGLVDSLAQSPAGLIGVIVNDF